MVNFTNEQIKLNREYVSNELSRIYKIASENKLIPACVIHWAPLSKCLESRVAYFEENYEANLWKEKMIQIYSDLDLPYEIY